MPPSTPEPPWAEVERLFLSALDLDPGERAAALAAESDPAVRDAAASLLAALDSSDGFLDGLDARPVTALLRDDGSLDDDGADPAPPLTAGDRVGVWRLVKEAGRGGMGVVWLAERADGAFAQRVALKLLPPGPGGSLGPRLVRERHALARLAHPAIARLLDGGEAADGRPFFAMEFVDGAPLTTWADTHRLSVDERVALFAEAVAAVRHAHRHLVVHRDLKPSNVFVTAGEDGRPQVKLLDFGLARLLDPDAAPDEGDGDALAFDGDLLTRPGVRPMTPEYAAPEQVRGEAVTTATDVYALGVVLYELLAGRRPYRFADRSVAAIALAIETADVEPPSVAVGHASDDGSTPDTIAAARNSKPKKLKRALAGDLDAVVARAMEKNPAARYPSAEALADDLARWRDGRPLTARTGQGDAGYRLRRFVGRNRLAVAGGVALAVALAAGITGTLIQSHAAAREAERAGAARDFLLSVFNPADPNIVAPDSVMLPQLLAMAADRAGTELADQPALRIALLCHLGRVEFRIGTPERAEEIFLQADSLRRTLPAGTVLLDPTCALTGLGTVRPFMGDNEGALAALREALVISRAALGPEHKLTATVEATLGQVLIREGENDDAEPLLVHALTVLRVDPGPDDAELTGYTTETLARLRFVQGRTAEAATLLAEVLRIRRLAYGDDHLDVATARANLARVLTRLGRLAEAERLERSTLALYRERLGPAHAFTWISTLNVTDLLNDEGRYAEVEPLLDQLALPAPDSIAAARRLLRLSNAALGQGRADEALRLAVAADRIAPPDADASHNEARLLRASVRAAQGDCPGARSEAAPLLDSLDATGRSTFRAVLLVARCHVEEGQGAEAVALLRRARQAAADPAVDALRRAEVDAALGRALVDAGRRGQAREPLTAALGVYTRALGARHPRTVELRRLLSGTPSGGA